MKSKASIITSSILGLIIVTLFFILVLSQINFLQKNISNSLDNALYSTRISLNTWMNLYQNQTDALAEEVRNNVDISSHFKNNDLNNFYIIDEQFNILQSSDYSQVNKKALFLLDRKQRFLRVWEGETVFIPIVIRSEKPFIYFATKSNSNIFLLEVKITEEYIDIFKSGYVGETGEVIFFDEKGRLLNQSRFSNTLLELGLIEDLKNSIYKFKLKDPGGNLTEGYKPLQDWEEFPLITIVDNAIKNRDINGLYPANDYRGVFVYGRWYWDKELNLGIASKIDLNEVQGFLYTIIFIAFGLFVCIIVLAILFNSLRVKQKIESVTLRKKFYEKYHTMFDYSKDALFILQDNNFKIIDLNIAGKELLTPIEPFSITDNSLISILSKYNSDIEDDLINLFETGKISAADASEVRIICKNGDIKYLNIMINSVFIENEKLLQVSIRDVTEKVNKDKLLQDNDIKLREAEIIAKLGSWEYINGSDKVWISNGTSAIMGFDDNGIFKLEDLVNMIPEEDINIFKNAFNNALQDGKNSIITHRVNTFNNNEMYLSNSLNPKLNAQGEVYKITGVIQDITNIVKFEEELESYRYHLEDLVKLRTDELKLVQEEVLNEKLLLDSIIESLPALFFMIDQDGKVVKYNRNSLDFTDIEENEMIGSSIQEIVSTGNKDLYKKILSGINSTGKIQYEVDIQTKYNTSIPFLLSVNSIKNKKELYIIIGTDLSNLKAAMNEIKKLSEVVEQNPTSIMITDLSGDIEYVNSSFTEATGYYPQEVIGKNPRLLQSGLTPDKSFKELWETITNGDTWKGEIINMSKSGEIIWENATIFPVFNNGKAEKYISIKEDITQKKELLSNLESSERRYRSLFEQAGDSILLIDPVDCKIVDFNDEAYSVMGYEKKSFYNIKMSKLENENSKGEFIIHSKHVIEDGSDSYETDLVNKKGEILHVWINSRTIEIEGKKYIQSIWRDITEIRQMERELIDAKNRAESSTNAKSMFLANMSHEIRTPMNSIIGFIELSLESNGLASNIRNYLKTSLLSAKSLLTIINDILDVSKLESGRMEIEEKTMNIYDFLEDLFKMFQTIVKNKKIEFQLNIKEDTPRYIIGDPVRIRQIIMNLLSNAIKFTSKGFVKLEVYSRKNYMYYKVIDSGIGMNKEQTSRIFSAFTQADSSTARKYGGTGLGTTISKQLTEFMGGTLSVESEENKGSVFKIKLPMKLGDQKDIKESNYRKEKTTHKENKQSFLSILVAEDVIENTKLLSIRLGKLGHKLTIVENGKHAVEEVFKSHYDLVLMDVHMPEMDGLEATINIRSRESGQRIPIIALTASVMEDEKQKCIEAGMDGVIKKPINFDELFKIINSINPIEDSNTYEGIEYKKGLEVWQDRDLYNQALNSFSMKFGKSNEALKKLIETEDIDEAVSFTHKIKGVAGNLFMSELYKICSDLEDVLKNRIIESYTPLMNKYEDELYKINKSLIIVSSDYNSNKHIIESIDSLIDSVSKSEVSDELFDDFLLKAVDILDEEILEDIKNSFDSLDFVRLEEVLRRLKKEKF